VTGSSTTIYATCLDRLKQPTNRKAGIQTKKYKFEGDTKYVILYYILQPLFQV
jgi:hypothetical protein